MPRIRCHYIDCVFLDDGFCGASAVEFDPDTGCATYSRANDLGVDDDWETEEDELDGWSDISLDDDDDDLWLEDDEY